MNPRTAENLSLVVHELVTNACKYGALSGDEGRVAVTLEAAGPRRARFGWVESGGPRVTPPAKKGFGSQLINTALGGSAEVSLSFSETGFHCEIFFDCTGAGVEAMPQE